MDEFRTETRLFRSWKRSIYLAVSAAVGLLGSCYLSLLVARADFGPVAFWVVLLVSEIFAWLIYAIVNLYLYTVPVGLSDPDFVMPFFHGITRVDDKGDIVVISTKTSRVLLRWPATNYTTNIRLGCRYEGQLRICEARSVNDEPVHVILHCFDKDTIFKKPVVLFSLTHDRDQIIAAVNGKKIGFPYSVHPDYIEVAKAVVHSCRRFEYLYSFDNCDEMWTFP